MSQKDGALSLLSLWVTKKNTTLINHDLKALPSNKSNDRKQSLVPVRLKFLLHSVKEQDVTWVMSFVVLKLCVVSSLFYVSVG